MVTAEPPSVLSPSAEEARARLQYVPGAEDVYTSDGYQLGRHDYLDDFLRYQPGLIIQSSQGAEATHVSSRGSGQDNDDASGLTILIDGIYFGPNVEWNIVKSAVDEANTLFADPYALLGFRAGYKTTHGFPVYFEGNKTCDAPEGAR